MNKKGEYGGWIFLGIFVLVIIIVFVIIGIQIPTIENGSHTGYITAIETNGLFFKTDSVYVKTDAQSSQEDRYCILNKTLKSELSKFENSRVLVTVHYFGWFIAGAENCKSDDEAIISSFELKPEVQNA